MNNGSAMRATPLEHTSFPACQGTSTLTISLLARQVGFHIILFFAPPTNTLEPRLARVQYVCGSYPAPPPKQTHTHVSARRPARTYTHTMPALVCRDRRS